MTTQEAQKPQETTVKVDKVATVAGRSGPQWELTVGWPWTRDIPDRIWVDKSAMPAEPALGGYHVHVVRTGVKRNKAGPYDGTQPWMWNYKVVAWDGPATAPLPVAAPAAQPAPGAPAVPAEASGAPKAAQGPAEGQCSLYLPDGTLWHRYISWGDLLAQAIKMRELALGAYQWEQGTDPVAAYSAVVADCLAAIVRMVRAEMGKP